MEISADVLQAKKVLSARLLRTGLQEYDMRSFYAFSVSNAGAWARHSVHAVGVGKKVINGRKTDVPCVRLHVAQKIAPSLLPPQDRLPKTIDGIPTDIIESLPPFLTTSPVPPACTMYRKRSQRPVIAGISAAHTDVTVGTIAYFCKSTLYGDDPSKVYVLSNNHVFANVNQARIGDDLYQPGPADGGTNKDCLARLHRFVPIQLGDGQSNRIDAAIGELLPGIAYQVQVYQIGSINGTSKAEEGMEVRKHGRTTGYTEGVVTDEALDVVVRMDHNNPNIDAKFEDQIRIEKIDPYSAIGQGGDSGSLVVNKFNPEAIGLYFAGPPDGTYGIASPIEDVLRELQIELL